MGKSSETLPGAKILEQAKQHVKQKRKEENQMNNKARKETIKTWTIVALAGIIIMIATSVYAFQKGIEAERAKHEEIKQAAQSLVTVKTASELKQ